jgi:hypothetical protein
MIMLCSSRGGRNASFEPQMHGRHPIAFFLLSTSIDIENHILAGIPSRRGTVKAAYRGSVNRPIHRVVSIIGEYVNQFNLAFSNILPVLFFVRSYTNTTNATR